MQNSYKVEFMKLSFSALGMLKLKKKKKNTNPDIVLRG